ncbi:DNA (cytosine-5-)-methyltransferase [Mucilaginibacter myungsuensis]|uniref:Cytosine-specific methyltransferase n=1 Tax=Mucilaginibacter myungsuensis TaxID=649104 RepID=A0A929KZJ3_9SPHI|nr:DNA (cytosine-5-)-methyltransferase [Mucilaginibacter myungsuensis]MBE9664599.1 DNA (cytosine-5-)-methyltransferase [Mucilaginibacter myungsuensis]MDN3601051.1 DNA (cytosine-5-)-methyltransferase [Mucilaginibacter myungsuensis]
MIKVAELFAGVGGFRLGLEGWQGKSATSGYTTDLKSGYRVVWSNQWEPSTKTQAASNVYEQRFGSIGHANKDIAKVTADEIPDHDMLVGGFPCQDYSVARTLNKSGGLNGKKGVLWWEIHRILKEKSDADKPVKYLFLENVDRLLKSPVKQRGRDFAIILASLSDLGYAVEWRVINAADYGFPQRRRRVFLLGYHKSSALYQTAVSSRKDDIILYDGVLARALPVNDDLINLGNFHIKGDLADISEDTNDQFKSASPFENAGIMIDREVTTLKLSSSFSGMRTVLKDVLLDETDVDSNLYVDEAMLSRWLYLKGAKNEMRVNKTLGFEYKYNEGGMVFPDPLDQPSRTIITGEGGASPSRFKHVVTTKDGRHRRLSPVELERLNMFPDNHTAGASPVKRAFFMGNALVVGIIEKVGQQLLTAISKR